MGVWAFYETCSQAKIDFYLSEDEEGEEFEDPKDIPHFEYREMYKLWYSLHILLTNGLTEPCQDNLMSNAIAGQYHTCGDDEELIAQKYWWWDFYGSGYNSNLRVKEISQALNAMDFNKIVVPENLKISNEQLPIYIKELEILRELYQNASDNNLAVIASFG